MSMPPPPPRASKGSAGKAAGKAKPASKAASKAAAAPASGTRRSSRRGAATESAPSEDADVVMPSPLKEAPPQKQWVVCPSPGMAMDTEATGLFDDM